jgi:8-oxo-dGTP diphosphatase
MSGRTRVGVYAVCVDADRLLLTRLWEHDVDAGRWTLPGGGMEWGEDPLDTLRRELWEECGLEGEVEGLFELASEVYPPWSGYDALHQLRIVYRVRVSGEPRVVEIGGSTVEARWVHRGELASLPLVGMVHESVRRLGW